MQSANIVLTGFMAVGKSKTARELALQTGMYAVDSDDLIESLANMKISRIFKTFGEEHFRALEKKTARWIEANVQNTILSTGGGFLNVPNLQDLGHIVYLHNEFEAILKRVHEHPNAAKKIRKRPLLGDREKARALYDSRLELYRGTADLIIEVGGLSIPEVAARIRAELDLPRV